MNIAYAKLQQYDRVVADYDQALAHSNNVVINPQGSLVEVQDAACADGRRACDLGYQGPCRWIQKDCQ